MVDDIAQCFDVIVRILKVGNRQGDAAEMSLIEFVDFNEAALASGKKEAKKSTRRSRAKKAEAPAAEAPATEEAPKAEEPKAE